MSGAARACVFGSTGSQRNGSRSEPIRLAGGRLTTDPVERRPCPSSRPPSRSARPSCCSSGPRSGSG
ncbi:hypothetical protein DM2_2731 [Halorubrum sp. DM2]|nr:hypothetical protein DM2_2731 [Halorubrum sp. DM2]